MSEIAPLQVEEPPAWMESEWRDAASQNGEDGPSPLAGILRGQLLTVTGLGQLPPPSWLIDSVLASNTVALLYGRPGSHKTFLSLDWMLSVVSGSWWFRRPVQQGRGLYIAAEGVTGLAQRVEAWKQDRRVHDVGDLWFLPRAVSLLEARWADAVVDLVDDLQPVFVVIDTLARSMLGGEENSARDMGQALETADRIRRASRACVLLVHHDRKDGGSARGSSALLGAVDTVVEVTADGPSVRLRCDKQKDARPFDHVFLERLEVGTSCVLTDRITGSESLPDSALDMLRTLDDIAADEGVSTSVWRDSSTVAVRSFYRWQKRLVELGFAATVGDGARRRYTITDLGKEAARA